MPHPPPTANDLRWFAPILAAVFGVLGAVLGWQLGSAWALRLWGAGAVLIAVYAALPPLRVPMFLSWMALVMPFGRAVSLVALAVVYFGMITPIALAMRPFRRDRLTRRLAPETSSYWSEREAAGEPDRYFRQS